MGSMKENLTRRQFVGVGALAAGLGLAGCSSSSSDASSSSSSSSSSSGALRGSTTDDYDADLVKSAQGEGSLVVYGCCEEPYISAACGRARVARGVRPAPSGLVRACGQGVRRAAHRAGLPIGARCKGLGAIHFCRTSPRTAKR